MQKTYYIGFTFDNSLSHRGVKGMHWGVRNYQNIDGSLTDLGYIHYYGHPISEDKNNKRSDATYGHTQYTDNIRALREDDTYQRIMSTHKKDMNSDQYPHNIVALTTRICLEHLAKSEGLNKKDAQKFIKSSMEEARVNAIDTSKLSKEEKAEFDKLTENCFDLDKTDALSKTIWKNWYNPTYYTAKTPELKDIYKEFKQRWKQVNSNSQAERLDKWFQKAVSTEVLKEMGYKPTDAAIEYIKPFVFNTDETWFNYNYNNGYY